MHQSQTQDNDAWMCRTGEHEAGCQQEQAGATSTDCSAGPAREGQGNRREREQRQRLPPSPLNSSKCSQPSKFLQGRQQSGFMPPWPKAAKYTCRALRAQTSNLPNFDQPVVGPGCDDVVVHGQAVDGEPVATKRPVQAEACRA